MRDFFLISRLTRRQAKFMSKNETHFCFDSPSYYQGYLWIKKCLIVKTWRWFNITIHTFVTQGLAIKWENFWRKNGHWGKFLQKFIPHSERFYSNFIPNKRIFPWERHPNLGHIPVGVIMGVPPPPGSDPYMHNSCLGISPKYLIFRNALKPIIDLCGISFLCANFETFTILSAIVLKICTYPPYYHIPFHYLNGHWAPTHQPSIDSGCVKQGNNIHRYENQSSTWSRKSTNIKFLSQVIAPVDIKISNINWITTLRALIKSFSARVSSRIRPNLNIHCRQSFYVSHLNEFYCKHDSL